MRREDAAPDELPTPQISVTSVPDVDTTVNGYLSAWKSLDYAAMYGLLSSQSGKLSAR